MTEIFLRLNFGRSVVVEFGLFAIRVAARPGPATAPAPLFLDLLRFGWSRNVGDGKSRFKTLWAYA